MQEGSDPRVWTAVLVITLWTDNGVDQSSLVDAPSGICQTPEGYTTGRVCKCVCVSVLVCECV